MTMPTINEIRQIEKELGLKKNAFGDEESERVKVIRYWSNCDVVACPGSGKTTVLLAKLLYLSRKMPFEDGKGICVLTHTNVAIDEIKKRLGSKANILFQHPNFFGTIQSFVDKFFGIPGYNERHENRKIVINSEAYLYHSIKTVFKYDFENDSCFFRNGYLYNNLTDEEQKYEWKDQREPKFLIFHGFKPFLENGAVVYKNSSKNKVLRNETSDTYKLIASIKEKIFEDGFMEYDSAYFFSDCFLYNHPKVKEIISNRFRYLLVDEMQDTQPNQIDIIDRVFNENVVKQFYGDPDQAIFNGISGGESAWRIDNGERLELSQSKRFRSYVAEVVSKFSEENAKIDGCGCSEENIKPYLILYKTGEEEQVVDKFKEIVKRHKLHELKWNKPTSPFKAIGFVGKDEKEDLRIQTYFPDYSKIRQNKKQYFENLISYLQKRPANEIKEKGTCVYFNLIISAILQMLQLSECKNEKGKYYNKIIFLKILQEKDEQVLIEFLKKVAVFVKEIQENGNELNIKKIKEDFLKYFMDKIAPLFESFDEKKVKDFVEDGTIEKVSDIPKVIGENDIEIEVSTVHSVKGETHMATLFLETSNYKKCESERLACNFCTKIKSEKLGKKAIERQKIAYVAMSRPSHLLCVAVNDKHLGCNNCTEEEKKDCIWQIENI